MSAAVILKLDFVFTNLVSKSVSKCIIKNYKKISPKFIVILNLDLTGFDFIKKKEGMCLLFFLHSDTT